MKYTVTAIDSPYPLWNDLKPYMTDDNEKIEDDGNFLGVFDGKIMAAVFLVKPWSDTCYEIHGGVSKKYWGKGVEILEDLGRAIFTMSSCLKIVAIVPEFNQPMRKCLQKVGLVQEGIIKKAFMKRMRLHDLYVYGVTKTEAQKMGKL